jgi:hypothetical protein
MVKVFMIDLVEIQKTLKRNEKLEKQVKSLRKQLKEITKGERIMGMENLFDNHLLVEELERIQTKVGEIRYYEGIGWCQVYNVSPLKLYVIDAQYRKHFTNIKLDGVNLNNYKLVAFVPDDEDEKDDYYRFVSALVRNVEEEDEMNRFVWVVL